MEFGRHHKGPAKIAWKERSIKMGQVHAEENQKKDSYQTYEKMYNLFCF